MIIEVYAALAVPLFIYSGFIILVHLKVRRMMKNKKAERKAKGAS